jgi:uncharacterized membrane protein
MTGAPPVPWWRHAIVGAAVVGYPAAVYAGLESGRPRWVAALLFAVLVPGILGRLRAAGWRRAIHAVAPVAPTIVLATLAGTLGEGRWLLAVPVLVNVSLLVSFATSLRPGGTPAVERFARMAEPELPPEGVAWCRGVTWVWIAFFAVNATVTAALGLLQPSLWALWVGVGAYVAMGVLFTAEYTVRKLRFRRYGDGPADRLLARLFPPRVPAP